MILGLIRNLVEVDSFWWVAGMSGVAVTSQGHIAYPYFVGVKVYRTTDMAHLYTIVTPTVTASPALVDVASKDEFLFSSDKNQNCIHVMKDSGSYSHNISVSWVPSRVAIHQFDLYVTDAGGDKVYKIHLDQNYTRISGDQVIMSYPTVDRPNYIYVNSARIAVTNVHTDNLVVSDINGTVLWTYGSYGTGDSQFRDPQGVTMDSFGRFLVCDCGNKRLHLVSAEGTYILQIPFPGCPKNALPLDGKLYISGSNYVRKYNIDY